MPEETPEETPSEEDVEAEMLRMMQEEVEGGGDAEDGDTAADDAAALLAAVDDGAGDDVDNVLEQEMLRAMGDGPGEAAEAVAPFAGAVPGMPQSVDGLERLAEIDVEVTVELGESHIPIQQIMAWERDSVVELEPEEHDPVNVLVNGRLFATGEVVVVGDTYGVRITELVNQPDEPTP
jgi:flagellar motor switch protein FliN